MDGLIYWRHEHNLLISACKYEGICQIPHQFKTINFFAKHVHDIWQVYPTNIWGFTLLVSSAYHVANQATLAARRWSGLHWGLTATRSWVCLYAGVSSFCIEFTYYLSYGFLYHHPHINFIKSDWDGREDYYHKDISALWQANRIPADPCDLLTFKYLLMYSELWICKCMTCTSKSRALSDAAFSNSNRARLWLSSICFFSWSNWR